MVPGAKPPKDSGQEFRTCFSAFRETLAELAIRFFSTSFSAFVALVNYFPNITTLRLGSFSLRHDEEPAPLLSRPLRGKIYIHYTHQDQRWDFVDRLAKLEMEYDRLVIESRFILRPEVLEGNLRLSPSTVRYLKLASSVQGGLPHDSQLSLHSLTQHTLVGPNTTLRHFQQLRELELFLTWKNSAHENLLPSITSTELRKLVFSLSSIWNVFPEEDILWASIDNHVCELAARLGRAGHSHILEVGLRPTQRVDGRFDPVFPQVHGSRGHEYHRPCPRRLEFILSHFMANGAEC